jgi:hypothetical protein
VVATAGFAATEDCPDGSTVQKRVTVIGGHEAEAQDGTPHGTTNTTTTHPGFTGHFSGKRRDAVATGTVLLDGHPLVEGATTNAEIETLHD